MSKLEADGPPGVAVQECCVLLLLSQDGAEWEELVKEIAEQIVFNCVPEKFSSPTAAYGEVKVQVHNLIMNDAFREVFFSKFNALGISVDVETVARFMGMFLRRFAHEISGALFRTMRRPEVGSSNPVQQPLTSRQKSLYHYVAGSAVKTLLRKGLLLRKAKNPKWTRIVNCLHTCFQETGANDSHQSEAHQWTSVIDRGGLTYVGEKAMEFFYLCGSIAKQVKPPSRYKFFEQVYQCKELVYMWEELVSDMLPADESSWLMEQLCRLFYNTYCKGYCNKARNEQLDKKSQACVSTRQRLARE